MESSFIDPGIGTAPKPDAGPSSGQVPRVALDESSEIVVCLTRKRGRSEGGAGVIATMPALGHSRVPIVRRQVETILGASGDRAAELEAQLARSDQLGKRLAEFQREIESREDLLTSLREAAAESVGEELSGVFQARATALGRHALKWMIALGCTAVLAVGGAIVTYVVLRPEEAAKDARSFAGLGLAIFIIGLFAFAVRVCAQNYRANRHLEAVANSKSAALATFRRLVASIEEQEIRAAVALALAQAVFQTEDTGFSESSGDHVTLVERALAPRVAPPAS